MSLFVDRRNLDFMLYDVGGLETLLTTERYSDYDRATITEIFNTAEAIAGEKYFPCAAKLDANEPEFDGELVHIIPEVSEAISAYRDAGFFGAGFDADVGGLQLPLMVTNAVASIFMGANLPLSNYHFLTIGAANMLAEFGNDAQKDTYLGPMLEGRWFGTMCLSEPQAGSSLSDITTKAEPTEDGHYLISGNKMWISGGEQEISDNIVHMVLAKIPGGPPGVKGISLFIVPKYRVNEDGSLGEKNNVALAGLNHKMGQRGTTNTLLNFGENGECHGYLIGEEHKGLFYMFHMMNEARIGVGLGATMSGLGGYLYSRQYATERLQGRHPKDKTPASPQVPIIEHTDVKRMLLAQKAYVEGALGLILYCSGLIDQQQTAESKEAYAEAGLLLDILTPIAKSWPSEFCLEANKFAIQILGGYGYTREFPVERHYRDNRLNLIHEGAHAIHGIDLLGRKVSMLDGKALDILKARILEEVDAAGAVAALQPWADSLKSYLDEALSATEKALACGDLNLRFANATLYLDALGHIVLAWMWLRQARAAEAALSSGADQTEAFYKGKLSACRYFFNYELPRVTHWLNIVGGLDTTCLDVGADEFYCE